MVDYSAALPQLQQYQAPNMLAMAEQANKMQLYNTMMQEKQRGFQESNALRDWIAKGGDVTTPAGQREAVALAPNAGPGFVKSNLDIIGQDRANKQAALGLTETQGRINAQGQTADKARLEQVVANTAHISEIIAKVADMDPVNGRKAYLDVVRPMAMHLEPNWAKALPEDFDAERLKVLARTGAQAATEHAAVLADQRKAAQLGFQIIENPDGSKTLVRVAPGGGTATPVQGGTSAAKPPAVWQDPNSGRSYQPIINANGEVIGQREVTPNNVAPPAARGAAATNPATIDAQIIGSEGLDRNPLSSAQGPGGIVDKTFVSAFKQMYPTQAQGMSDDAILARRSPELQTQMVSYLRNQNVAALPQGVTPDAGNLKLMHFLGQPDALKVFNADPNTPVEQLVSPAAIAANSSILAGKTAGQVIQWARANMNAQGGTTPTMTGGGGTPTQMPNAVTNNLAPALAPNAGNALPGVLAGMQPVPQTPLSLNPAIAGNLSPKAAAQQEAERAKLAVTPQPGFEKLPDGSERPIKGGPADPAVIAAKQTATTAATKNAELQVKAADTLPKLRESTQVLKATIDQLIGNTKIDAKGNVIEDKKAPLHPGFGQAVGFSASKLIAPNTPFAGTDRADFEALFKQTQGGAFLEAYDQLRGAGGIALEEGRKATEAKNAMSLATTEKAFIKAANDYRTSLDRGLAIVEKQAAGGAAPAAATAGGTAPADGGAPVAIKNDQEYSALTKGTLYTAPDGSVRRKQ